MAMQIQSQTTEEQWLSIQATLTQIPQLEYRTQMPQMLDNKPCMNRTSKPAPVRLLSTNMSTDLTKTECQCISQSK